jgi:uncharacterized protein (DUF1015 family)
VADVQPLRALRYDTGAVGGLQAVVAPPYDVIDDDERSALLARSERNIVALDLPRDPSGGDPYDRAAQILRDWRVEGVLVEDGEPALWALEQGYTGPDGRPRTRHGLLARVKVQPYGPGRIRPHERTHPGPKEDRLRLTRATRTAMSPIFSLYDDPEGGAWGAVAPHVDGTPYAEVTDADGTRHRLWRIADPEAAAAVHAALAPVELLIADGHHRYETARVYAEEVGGEGGHEWVLMCLVALQDPGLTVFPTHRLLHGLDAGAREALRAAIERDWDAEPVNASELEPPAGSDGVSVGYLDAHARRPLRLTLRDPEAVAAALPDKPDAYRGLDTAVLEALILNGALGMSEDDIAHLRGLSYARSTGEAIEHVAGGKADAAFFMGATPVQRVRDVAAAGETMPPKSTYFFPKVPTGLVMLPLGGDLR